MNRGLRESLFRSPSLQAIAAAQATQVAADADASGKHSPFTSVLLDALRHGPSGGESKTLFTASELFAYIPNKVRRQGGVNQDPRGGWLDGEGDFYFFPKGLTDEAVMDQTESFAEFRSGNSEVTNQRRYSLWLWLGSGIVLSSLATATGVILVRRENTRKRNLQSETDKRTRRMYQLKDQLMQARQQLCDGKHDSAKQICAVILEAVPDFPDALAILRVCQNDGEDVQSTIAASTSELYLQVTDSPYAYHAPRGASRVTIRRQKRKPEQAANEGNDFVIRVPGSDAKTQLISRRHLEIDRIGHEYFIVDRSTAGTKLNGKPLLRGQAAPVVCGDRVFVAGVLTFEIVIRRDVISTSVPVTSAVDLNLYNNRGVVVEASIGDFVTVDPE